MAVSVYFSCSCEPNTDEAIAAKWLKDLFVEEFKDSDINGNLYIIPSLQIYGQAVRDIDMVVMGNFDGLTYDHVKTKQGEDRCLKIESFIANIELKSMPCHRIKRSNGAYQVKYENTGWHDASDQCRKAKFSLRDHIKEQLCSDFYIVDLLWFRSVNTQQLNDLRNNQEDNVLPNSFSVKQFFEKIALSASIKQNSFSVLNSPIKGGRSSIEDIYNLLIEERTPVGLTLRKFNAVSVNSESVTDIVKNILNNTGSKLNYITGRAGTGKTILLLQTAFCLASEQKKRCKILTYNNALVSDIKRVLDFTKIPDGINKQTISISTFDSFFQTLFRQYKIINSVLIPVGKNYTSEYGKAMQDLLIRVQKMSRCHDDKCIKEFDENLDWDYILIDEAQDVSDIEKELFFLLYSPKRLIIADGVDQFVKSNTKQNWIQGIEDFSSPKSLILERRQKSSLARFLNAFASRCTINWKVEENIELTGGEIFVVDSYDVNIHQKLKENCKNNECENYDILILEPPSLGETDENGIVRFRYLDDYKRANINVFDGFNAQNRQKYPTHDECRLFQYDSCRGLEGWCVVCDFLDELVEYKMNQCVVDNDSLLSENEQRRRYALLWTLIPLTRAVDTLVITLKDPDSEIGVILKDLCDSFSSFAHWNINQN